MAARLFNAIGKLGLGIAVVGGVGQSALYNGMYALNQHWRHFHPVITDGLFGVDKTCLERPKTDLGLSRQNGFIRSAPAVTVCHCALPDRWSCG